MDRALLLRMHRLLQGDDGRSAENGQTADIYTDEEVRPPRGYMVLTLIIFGALLLISTVIGIAKIYLFARRKGEEEADPSVDNNYLPPQPTGEAV